MKTIEIVRFKAIPGCYGERIETTMHLRDVGDTSYDCDRKVDEFFKLVSLWSQGGRYDIKTGILYTLWELPIGASIEDAPLALALERMHINVKESSEIREV